MTDQEFRYLLRKQWIQVKTPPTTDWRLIGLGRVLVLVGWIVAALVWFK